VRGMQVVVEEPGCGRAAGMVVICGVGLLGGVGVEQVVE
jgi:hypothetical protein